MTEREIFAQAIEIQDARERHEFLDSACRGDAALRERLEALLAARENLGTYLEVPAVAPMETIDRAPAPRIGTRIGPYKLLQELGQGGMGSVYLAEQQHPVKRQVALKVIKAGMDSAQVIARFEAERQALAMMDHLNIAKVLDAGTTVAGCPYFVMELVKGVPITKFCDEWHLTLKQRLELFVFVCQALQHAHQKGIIHRDIKPTNVLVALYDETPVPKVIDFGVAKATAQRLTEKTMFTGFGQLIGTLEYMSPEQARFNQLDIDTRSDIYSLGALLYELLTGTTPLDQARQRTVAFDETLRIIREEEPPKPSTRLSAADTLLAIASNRSVAPSTLCRKIAGELDWIAMKALEKDRTRRYQTASDLAADVLRYLHDEPVQACPPTISYRLRKFARRNKVPVVAGLLVLLVLVGGVVATTRQMIRATDARALVIIEAAQKEIALQAAQESERNAKDQLFLALLNQARAGRFSRQIGQRLDSLAALAKAAQIRPDERLRDEAIAAMALPDVRGVPVACTAPPGTTAIGFDSNYRLYARADAQGISIRRTADDWEIQHIASGPILGTALYFSPDGQFLLAVGAGRALGLWRVADGQRVIRDDYRECWANAFSPDGRRLAVGQNERVICFDLPTGQEVNRWALPSPVHSLAFHPDSIQLAIGSRTSVVWVYDARTGTLISDLAVGAVQDQVVAWHPNGERLAVCGLDPRIQIWNVAARRKIATLEGHVQYVSTLTFHPDGSLLASFSWDGTLRLWDPATGRPLLQLPIAVTGNPRFSRNGRWLAGAFAGARAELLEVTPNGEYRTLVSSGGIGVGAYTPSDISPDGRLLVVGKQEGMEPGARLWDLRSGREVAALPAGTNFVCFDGAPHRLLTCGSDGLRQWPMTSDDSGAGRRLRLGPPLQLSTFRRGVWFACTSDGRTLGAVTVEGGANKILDLETGTIRQDLGIHPNAAVGALSPDGRWAASSGWHAQSVRLWNIETGQMIHEWVLGNRTFVFFTPDSRSLIISRPDEFSFWDIGTLQSILRLPRDAAQFPGHVSFSPDGKLMALEMAPAIIHLKEVATGRTVAKLEDPHGNRATWQGFTPDGTQLVVVSSYSSAIHIWDLRAIRTRLKEMKLDWDWPEFPPESTSQAPRAESLVHAESEKSTSYAEREFSEPLTIEVDLGELAKPLPLTREQKAQQTIERYRNFEARPETAMACNALAWALLTGPERFRNAKDAVPLAERALQLQDSDSAVPRASYRNTLGLAYYRTGRYRDAVEVLRENVTAQADGALAFDLYFLAMSYCQLGDAVRAREYYDLAVRWTMAQKNISAGLAEELKLFLAEAEEVLGVKNHEQ
jgi:eukaryotic-like serine/threonine-protein kinase